MPTLRIVAVMMACSMVQIIEKHESKPAVAGEFGIVGYLPDYRLAKFDPAAAEGVTDLVYFSADPDPSGAIDRKRLGSEVLKTLKAIKREHPVRLALSVGGWERSAGFAKLASAAESRARFANEAAKFCKDEGFDGIDLDWEHPKGAAEVRDHGALLAAIREEFAPRGLRLTIAVAAWQDLTPEAIGSVDGVYLMAYDNNGRHSTPEQAEADVRRMLGRGVPAAKLYLGVPFYGRSVDKGHREVVYADIVAKYAPTAAVDEVDHIYFNGPVTIAKKVAFAREKGLGGVMIWELGQDVPGPPSLLKAIRRAASAR